MSRFGESFMLDMYGCKNGVCDDLELHYRFLEELVYRIGMTAMGNPVVIHAPVKFDRVIECGQIEVFDNIVRVDRREVFPDKEGVSGWVPLIESGIQIHSLEPSHFIALDVFTCGRLNPNVIIDFAHDKFGFSKYEQHHTIRGNDMAAWSSGRTQPSQG